MNITYFINFYPTNHKIVAHDEMIEMTKLGHIIKVVAVWGGEKDRTKDIPFDVTYLKDRINPIKIITLFIHNPLKSIKHYFYLKKYLGIIDSLKFYSNYDNIGNPDHVHAHFANNAALKAMLFSKYKKVPFSCTGHGSELLLYPEKYLLKLILSAKPFITISRYNKILLEKKYSLQENIIQVNYCGIDTNYWSLEEKVNPEIFTITSVTALKQVKGISYLIDACKILKRKGIQFICNIIGGGNLYNEYVIQIKKYNLENNVFLLGIKTQDEIKLELKKSSCFVLPSLSEGIPVSVMEAMAMELPVISTNITGLPEIIESGINGYLVPSEDSNTLAQKIIELHDNKNIMKQFIKNSRQTILKQFNIKTNVKKFEELITF